MDVQDDEQVRHRIRQMLESGHLPCAEVKKVWAGQGTGSHCAACGTRVDPTEIEYEVEFPSEAGTSLRLHRVCHTIWHEECGRSLART